MDDLKLLKSVLPISEAIKKQVDCQYFLKEGYLFKEVKTKTAYCTCCKSRYKTNGLSVDGMVIRTPSPINCKRHNSIMYCDCCGSPVTVKDAGRGRRGLQDYLYVGIFQKLRNGSLLLRTFLCERDYSHDYENVETTYDEKYRVFFLAGQVISFKKEYWDGWKRLKSLPKLETLNFGLYEYMSINYINADLVSKCKNFKYSMFDEFKKNSPESIWHKYLYFFCKHPILAERLIKEGFSNVIKVIHSEKMRGSYLNYRADTVKNFFRMNKEELKFLKNLPEYKIMDALKVKSFNLPLNQNTLYYAAQEQFSRKEIIEFIKNKKIDLDVDRLISLFIRQDQTFIIYFDYINWLIKYRFKLTSKRLLPRYLKQEHDYMMEYNRRKEALKQDKANKKKLEKFKNDFLPALQEIYTFNEDGYVIRPFESISEIITEGQVQNICVGGSNYTNKYMAGQTNLFCLREVNSPKTPFCTVEVSTQGKLIQSRMKYNQAPPDDVKQFIEKWQQEYTKRLKKSKNKKKEVA